jgi:hypothetical protein
MHTDKLPLAIRLSVIVSAIVLGILGFVAISERAITTGGRAGIHHAEGVSALVVGFGLIGFALAALGSLAFYGRFRNLIWLSLLLLWMTGIAVYAVAVSPP